RECAAPASLLWRADRMSTVWIPQVLRAQTGGQKQLDLAGGSVGEVVTTLVEQFPSLRGPLLTEGGDITRFVNVYVNGQDVRYLDGLKTPVGERDEVRLLPAMAGGGGGRGEAPRGGSAARWAA